MAGHAMIVEVAAWVMLAVAIALCVAIWVGVVVHMLSKNKTWMP